MAQAGVYHFYGLFSSSKLLLEKLLSDLQKAIYKIRESCIRKDPVASISEVSISGASRGKIESAHVLSLSLSGPQTSSFSPHSLLLGSVAGS